MHETTDLRLTGSSALDATVAVSQAVVGHVVAALSAIAAADTVDAVGLAAVHGAVEMTSARAGAVGLLAAAADSVELIASTGYECESMGAGTRVPLRSGLPLTEAARTGRTVVAGPPDAPRWVAVAFTVTQGLRGALLVSLTEGSLRPDIAALDILARQTGAALARARRYDATEALARAATEAFTGPRLVLPTWLDAAVRVLPVEGDVGGRPDVDDRSCWFTVADVCGAGPEAAVPAVSVRQTARAASRYVPGPLALAEALESALASSPGSDRFVTAVVGRAVDEDDGVRVDLTVAGHPLPLLWSGGRVVEVGSSGTALNLGLGVPAHYSQATVRMARGDALLCHTDGLTDRLRDTDSDEALRALLARGGALGSGDAIAEALVAGLQATTGPARDDLALLVLRVPT